MTMDSEMNNDEAVSTKAASTTESVKMNTKKAVSSAQRSTAKAASAAQRSTAKAASTARDAAARFTLPFDLARFDPREIDVNALTATALDAAHGAKDRATAVSVGVRKNITYTVTLFREAVGI